MTGRNFNFCAVLMMLLFAGYAGTESHLSGAIESPHKKTGQSSCATKQELRVIVQEFSSKRNYAEMERTNVRLEENATISAKCREEVIGALIEAMDKPKIDLLQDFHLWRYGAALLGKLKATESLDLLISHLNLTDGTSINVSHYPAMEGLIKFGPPAITKLSAALRRNPDRNYRLNAVFCIAQIGGVEAISALKNALPFESDSCVRNFMQVSLDSLNNPRTPGEITASNRDKWFAAFNCTE